jgi:hypothetical protein
VAGCDLVVFESSGGHRFRKVLGPDQTTWGLGLSRLFGTAGFVAYAVTRDDDLRHELTRDVTTWDQAGSFVLRCILTLRVANPREVVEQLARDPLRRLEEMAAHLFHHAASRIDWVTIENLGIAFERQVLESESIDSTGKRASNMVLLRAFAAKRGFELQNVDLTVVFSAEFGEVVRRRREEHQRQELLKSSAETAELDLKLKHDLEIEKSKLMQVQTAQETLRSLITSSGSNLESILTNIADKVSTPAALRSVVVELLDTFGQMSRIVAHGEIAAGSSASALKERVLAHLEVTTGTVEPIARRVSEVVSLTEEISCDRDAKDRLLSAALHFLGELALDGKADAGSLESYRASLQKGFEGVLPGLKTQAQHEVLIGLLSLKSLAEAAAESRP